MLTTSVIIPVHNEEQNVAQLAREIHAISEQCQVMEIIFVDDHSSDNTLMALKELKLEIPILSILHHQKQCGQSAALFSGIKHAQTDWVVTIDGDGQNDPADIPLLVNALDSCAHTNVKLVNGNRNKKNTRKDTAIKRLSSKVANRVRAALLKDNIPDSGCGLKLMHRQTYLSLPYFTNLHRFTPALFLRTGADIISVDVGHRPRTNGHSHYGLFDRLWIGIVDLIGVSWLMKKGYKAQVEKID